MQKVIKDLPFTRLDLLICRNVLIYLNARLQSELLPLFHYSLKPKGLLFLGSSETIGRAVDLFTVIDRKWKTFERKDALSTFLTIVDVSSALKVPEIEDTQSTEKSMYTNDSKLIQLVEKILLDSYAPACIAIDEKNNIIYIHGKTGKYIEFASGEASLNILKMVSAEIRPKIIAAIRKVNPQNPEVVYTGLKIKDGTNYKYINLRIRATSELEFSRKLLLIFFEEIDFHDTPSKGKGKRSTSEKDKMVTQLDQELSYPKESLYTTIEELETSNEELKSSNKELQSTNEELQSTNEKIVISKEELQSLNEELNTINAEFESKIAQLSAANEDIKNLLDNIKIATIFLDKNLCIKRFTPTATEVINLINSDVGRPISHIVSNLKYEKLVEDAKSVLITLKPKHTEVEDKNGRWYVISIMPSYTISNVVDGVVIVFLNIHAQKVAEGKLAKIVDSVRELKLSNMILLNAIPLPAITIDDSYKITGVNALFSEVYQVDVPSILDKSLSKLSHAEWPSSKMNELIQKQFLKEDKNKEWLKKTIVINDSTKIEVQKIAPKTLLLLVFKNS